MEDAERMSMPPLATGCNPCPTPVSDQKEEHAHPSITQVADVQNERPDELIGSLCDSPGESTALLCSDKPSNPYRSQSSVETPAPKNIKQSKHLLPEKQQEKTVTVYVTLDMFEQGQRR